jgi:outer membrane receptor for ferrienterochelin and colicins
VAAVVALAAARGGAAAAEPPEGSATGDPAPIAPAVDPPAAEVEVVVTGTRTRERGARAPVRTEVVTRDEARRRGATNVAEALASQPGVEVNPGAHGAIGAPSAIRIQGLDRERVLVLEDGEPVLGDTGGAVDLATIPVEDVERIELVTGPVSSLYGASAIGGVVNVITGPPRRQGASATGRLELRSRPAGLAAASGALREGPFWVGVDASAFHAAGLAAEGDPPRTALPRTTRTLLGVRGGLPLGDAASLSGRVRWIRDDATGFETQLVPGLGPFVVDLPDRADRFAARIAETVVTDDGHTIELAVAGQAWLNEAGKDRRGSPVDERRLREHTQRALEATATLFGGRPVTPTIGVRVEAERFGQHLERDVATPSGSTTERRAEVPPTSLASAAAYAQLRLAPTPGLVLLPGVRAEGYSRYDAAVAPRLAVSWSPDETLVVRGSGGRGYRTPSAKEFGFVFDHSFYGYRVEGNAALSPESSWGLTTDVAWTPVPEMRLRAAAFSNWIDELIDLRFGRRDPSGVDVYEYVNVGEARTWGASADVFYRVGAHLRSEVSYAWLGTRDDATARPLPGRPTHVVTAGGTAWLPGEVELNARFRVHSRAYLDDRTATPGYATLDVRIARPLAWGLGAYVGVVNALDATKDPTRIADQRPIEGRTFFVGLVADLPEEEE